MNSKLPQLIENLNKLPESCIDTIIKNVTEMLVSETADSEIKPCPYCKDSNHVIRYGKKHGKQRFYCKHCSTTFITTTNTILFNSHCNSYQWDQLIHDTVTGHSIDYTAKKIGFSHDCVFHMRHKFLLALQDQELLTPTQFNGVAEADECFVLESFKGTPISKDYWRKSRKHGAKAQSRGISNEYICICAGCERNGNSYAQSVNRAKPDSDEIKAVMSEHIGKNTLLITDGLRSYNALKGINQCTVSEADQSNQGFYNLNRVNGFHSFIKSRYNYYKGVATKYLNRYNALFSLAFASKQLNIDEICGVLCEDNYQNRYFSKNDVKTLELLAI